MFAYIFNRLKERSTWLGIIALATACGATIETILAEQIIAAGMALAGIVGIMTKDGPDKTTEEKENTSDDHQ